MNLQSKAVSGLTPFFRPGFAEQPAYGHRDQAFLMI
jgi:hypothetical protein